MTMMVRNIDDLYRAIDFIVENAEDSARTDMYTEEDVDDIREESYQEGYEAGEAVGYDSGYMEGQSGVSITLEQALDMVISAGYVVEQ